MIKLLALSDPPSNLDELSTGDPKSTPFTPAKMDEIAGSNLTSYPLDAIVAEGLLLMPTEEVELELVL